MKKHFGIFISVLVVVIIFLSVFIVKEGQQAIIVQFGRIVGKPITTAGLHFKVPLIQEVRFYEKRILVWDGDINQIPTKDKKYIWVDTTARWKIKDLIVFAEKVRTVDGAHSRLDSILDGATRDIISKHNLVEAVRNSNNIVSQTEKTSKAKEEVRKQIEEDKGVDTAKLRMRELELEEEISGEIEKVEVGREKISQMIIERAKENLDKLGIELIDVQLRRIAYEKSVESKVYDRMISERKRIAEKIRSIGNGEKAKIEGKLNKDLKQIESNAYRKSQIIKGKAEAEAIAIYAAVINQDKEFFEFQRSLDAYKNTIKKKTNIIISTDSEYLKYLK